MCITLPGEKQGAIQAAAANSLWPSSRLGTNFSAQETRRSATYGAFLDGGAFALDAAAFGISRTEAGALDPAAMLVLEMAYGAFRKVTLDCRT
jgi:acyl transferase domain-containing protein